MKFFTKTTVKLIYIAVFIFLSFALYFYSLTLREKPEEPVTLNVLPVAEDLPMREAILNIASAKGIDKRVTTKIVDCESKWNPQARNPVSTAKGIFQFLNYTWANNCKGDVFNWRDNTNCFANNFKAHKSWWASCIN